MAAGEPKESGEFGAVAKPYITPLDNWFAASSDFRTEAGVSFLVGADETTVLLMLALTGKRKARHR